MEGRIVTNESTGEKAFWDGEKLTPVKVEMDKNQPGFAEDQKTLAGPMKVTDQAPTNVPPVAADIEKQARQGTPVVTKQPARFPGAEKFAQEYAGPVATGIAGLVPGGLAVQTGLGALTEALGEKLGGKELDPSAIATSAAVPAAARGLMGAGKAVARSLGKMTNKEGMLEAGIEKIKGKFGVGNAANEALSAAKNKATQLTSDQLDPISEKLLHTIDTETKNLGGSKEAVKAAEDIFDKVNNNNYTYGDMFESITGLRQMADKFYNAGDKRGGNAIKAIRSAAIDQLDTLGPEASDAVKLYKRQEALNDISDTLRKKARPINAFEDLMANDKLVSSAFSKSEAKQLSSIVKDLGTENLLKIVSAAGIVGGAGFAAGGPLAAGAVSALPIVLGSLVSTPVGKVFAKSLIGPDGHVSKSVMPAFAQYLRGYMASEGESK